MTERTVFTDRRNFMLMSGAIAAAGAITLTQNNQLHAQAVNQGPRQQFRAIRDHENAHVNFLVTALGTSARPKPTFQNLQQPNLASFVAVAWALEQTGVGAYLGAVDVVNNVGILSAAASIALIEARHAGYLNGYRSWVTTRNVFNEDQNFDRAFTVAEVVANAGPFIAGLNGGPPISYNETTPSPANDTDILNFALALEYLEAEFYDINVPIFFN